MKTNTEVKRAQFNEKRTEAKYAIFGKTCPNERELGLLSDGSRGKLAHHDMPLVMAVDATEVTLRDVTILLLAIV